MSFCIFWPTVLGHTILSLKVHAASGYKNLLVNHFFLFCDGRRHSVTVSQSFSDGIKG